MQPVRVCPELEKFFLTILSLGQAFWGCLELLSNHEELTSLLVRGGNSNNLHAEIPDLGENLPWRIGGCDQLV